MNEINKKIKIAVIGGDARQIHCARKLSELGFETALFGFDNCDFDVGKCTRCQDVNDALSMARAVILPLPVTRDGFNVSCPYSDNGISLAALFSLVGDGAVILGGKIDECLSDMALKTKVKLIDYNEREEFQVANAYLTAESAVAIAMNELGVSLLGLNVLVMGYGRIGKCLCMLMKSLGANVYASARKKKDFEWIRAFGYSSVDTSKVNEVLPSCRIVFNTIPQKILDEQCLQCVDKRCIIIDLASKPGGVDFEAANKNNLRTIWALALPGKKLAESAGNVLCETVTGILEEEDIFR